MVGPRTGEGEMGGIRPSKISSFDSQDGSTLAPSTRPTTPVSQIVITASCGLLASTVPIHVYRLRPAELATVTVEELQRRVFADLSGKGGHVRTVPLPDWVGSAIEVWLTAAAVTGGPIFLAINKAGRVASNGFSPKVI